MQMSNLCIYSRTFQRKFPFTLSLHNVLIVKLNIINNWINKIFFIETWKRRMWGGGRDEKWRERWALRRCAFGTINACRSKAYCAVVPILRDEGCTLAKAGWTMNYKYEWWMMNEYWTRNTDIWCSKFNIVIFLNHISLIGVLISIRCKDRLR
jgi:hypothetical protein